MQVICTLPNAASEINGVAFSEHPNGRISDPIDTATAERFLRIPGYIVATETKAEPAALDESADSPASVRSKRSRT